MYQLFIQTASLATNKIAAKIILFFVCLTEIALMMDKRRNACVVAFETCYIYSLSKVDLDSVLSNHPDLKAHLEAEARRRLVKSAPTGYLTASFAGSVQT